MNRPKSKNRSRSKKKTDIKWVTWGIRIGIIAVLGVFIYLAIVDNSRKGQAESTATAWRTFFRKNKATTIGDLEKMMEGSPQQSEGKDTPSGLQVRIYKWKQLFLDDYEIHVEYSKTSKLVDAIDPRWGKPEKEDE